VVGDTDDRQLGIKSMPFVDLTLLMVADVDGRTVGYNEHINQDRVVRCLSSSTKTTQHG
jgi:hypothetical protein